MCNRRLYIHIYISSFKLYFLKTDKEHKPNRYLYLKSKYCNRNKQKEAPGITIYYPSALHLVMFKLSVNCTGPTSCHVTATAL